MSLLSHALVALAAALLLAAGSWYMFDRLLDNAVARLARYVDTTLGRSEGRLAQDLARLSSYNERDFDQVHRNLAVVRSLVDPDAIVVDDSAAAPIVKPGAPTKKVPVKKAAAKRAAPPKRAVQK